MRILLDEGVARDLADALIAHGISAAPFPNEWKGLRNGRLLARAEAQGFAVLLTNDRNLYRQQNLAGRKLAVVALPTSRPKVVLPRAHDIAQTLSLAEAGDCITINFNGSRRLDRAGRTELLAPVERFSG